MGYDKDTIIQVKPSWLFLSECIDAICKKKKTMNRG